MSFTSLLELFFLGLPSIIVFLVISLIGVITKRAILLLLGAIISVPFAWSQSWYALTLAVPFILVGALIAIRRKMNTLSWIFFLLAFSVVVLWIVKSLSTQ